MPYVRFDVEVGQRICELLASGKSLTAICREPWAPDRHTVMRWLSDPANAAFRDAHNAARWAWADHVFEEIAELADAAPRVAAEADAKGENANAAVAALREQIRAKMWVAARLRPDKYGDRISAEVSGPGGRDLIPERSDPDRIVAAFTLALATLPTPLVAVEHQPAQSDDPDA